MGTVEGRSADLDAGLAGHWKLHGDCRDCSGNENHGSARGADLTARGPGGRHTAARFDGRRAYIEVPSSPSLNLGSGDFSIAAWVETEAELDDVIGDIISKYDANARKGFNLNVVHNASMITTTANYRHVHFGIDNARLSSWQDCGRPGEAVMVCALTVHDGHLYAGTYEYGAERTGHVYRYDGDGRWMDCGSPDGSNAVMALCVHQGDLCAGTGCHYGNGSRLPNSPNLDPGGRVHRYLGGTDWADCGKLGKVNDIYALCVFRGQLFGTSMYQPGVFRLEDDEWVSCGLPGGQGTMALGVWNGSLYVTTNNNVTGVGTAGVWRYLGQTDWEHCGEQPGEAQTYSIALYQGDMHVGTWPSATVWRYEGGRQWRNVGRMGQEREVMSMAVYNGKLYCGTLPSAEVYRYDGAGDWGLVGQLDHTPDVEYRRVWSMAVYQGKLFGGTLPSGHVHCMEAGKNATMDRELPPGWHHLAAVKGGNHLTLYMDGEPVATSTPFDPGQYDISNDKPLNIGFGAHDYFNGCLSDLRLYNRPLSDADVKTLFGDPCCLAGDCH